MVKRMVAGLSGGLTLASPGLKDAPVLAHLKVIRRSEPLHFPGA